MFTTWFINKSFVQGIGIMGAGMYVCVSVCLFTTWFINKFFVQGIGIMGAGTYVCLSVCLLVSVCLSVCLWASHSYVNHLVEG